MALLQRNGSEKRVKIYDDGELGLQLKKRKSTYVPNRQNAAAISNTMQDQKVKRMNFRKWFSFA